MNKVCLIDLNIANNINLRSSKADAFELINVDNNLLKAYEVVKQIRKKQKLVSIRTDSVDSIKKLLPDAVFSVIGQNSDILFEYCIDYGIVPVLLIESQNVSLEKAKKLQDKYNCFVAVLAILIREDPGFNKEKTFYLDLPLCLAEDYQVNSSLRHFNSVFEVVNEFGEIITLNQIEVLKSDYLKRASCCKTCEMRGCVGCNKGEKEILNLACPTKPAPVYKYSSLLDSIIDSIKVQHSVVVYHSDTYKTETLQLPCTALQAFRKNEVYSAGYDFYNVIDLRDPIFFNRPLEFEELFQETESGLVSLNLRWLNYKNEEIAWKQKCNIMVPSDSLVVLSKISLKNKSKTYQDRIKNLTFDVVKRVILENGGEESKFQNINNDLLYNGKKFAGKEWIFVPDVGYVEDSIVTCSYDPDLFKLIYHHDKEKQLTGITDELPNVTKELLTQEVMKEIKSLDNI